MSRLAVVYFGNSPAVEYYHRLKTQAIKRQSLQISCFTHESRPDSLKDTLENLKNDSNVAGISIFLPLPPNLRWNDVASWIDQKKDVEGLRPGSKRNVYAFSLYYYLRKVGLASMPFTFVGRDAADVFSPAFTSTMKGCHAAIPNDDQLGLDKKFQVMIENAKKQVEAFTSGHTFTDPLKVELITDDDSEGQLWSEPSSSHLRIDMRDLRPDKLHWPQHPRVLNGLPIYAMVINLTLSRTARAGRGL
ncbi:hypothetical protein EDB80DRAFT_737586 [Ilyonectria destructans]|nr:hypothetical protein EDB80DRAFT_737586 [Ilyonectria destructans]